MTTEEKLNEDMTKDVITILYAATTKFDGDVSHSELVKSLRHGYHWHLSLGRRWKLSAGYINYDLSDLLDELPEVIVERSYKDGIQRCVHYSLNLENTQ